MKNTVFIHTNEKQMVGAIVSEHSFQRNSKNPDAFDVKIIRREDFPFFNEFEGRKFLRAGTWRVWKNADLQSFTPTRFMPPELMNYEGRAVVVDPDVFAVGDVNELFERDMKGHAVLAKPRPGHNGRADYVATSVMLLDCAKLKHWKVSKMFADMFAGKLHAALDRQHPRDLFDLQPLLDEGRLDERLWRTFLVYLTCSSKPAAEMLSPQVPRDFDQTFAAHFQGMTAVPVTSASLLEVRVRLLQRILELLDAPSRAFLDSVEREAPDFRLIELPHAADLPGVRRKLTNLGQRSAAKRAADYEQLKALFGRSS